MTERTPMSDALDNDTSFWENLKTRTANVKKTASRQKPDDNPYLNSAELAIAALGQTAGYAGDVAGEFVPEALQQVGEYLGEAVMSTSPAQAVSRFLTDVSEEYPRTSDLAGNLLNIGGATGAGALTKSVARNTGTLGNQVAASMPTLIEGFYSGTPYTSFLRDALKEVPRSISARTSAAERASERVTGIPTAKLDDIENQSKVAQRMEKQAASKKRKAELAQKFGFEKQAKRYNETAENLLRKAKISGQDSEFTAMSIEAGRTPEISPISERGALWNSPYKLAYYDAGIPREDVGRLSAGIGNTHRIEADIPEDIIGAATNHLVNGPHITSNRFQNKLFEFQVKTTEASRKSGVTEGSGAKQGSLLMRSFFNSASENTTSGIQGYAKKIKAIEGRDLTPEDTIEYAQLAGTLNKDAVQKLNTTLSFGSDSTASVLLDRLSKARASQRAGRSIGPEQQKTVDAFNMLVETGQIKPSRITDADGTVVGNLDYNKIKRPNKFIKTSTYFASQQKELGGVNQWVAIDPYNKTTYGMISDGHDIFGLNPVGGHSVITTQPIMKQNWSDVGFKDQHKSNISREKVSELVKEVERRTGVEAPKNIRDAKNKDYYNAAKNWTKTALRAKQTPTSSEIIAANKSKTKVLAAPVIGTGLLTGQAMAQNNQEE